ncbi:MAG: tryptophan synthase subunit alpha [Oscillospiraceae bacterium]|nr:tryptophan synthase subunit alpha [Oscillospiraceae bacterium]
MNRISKAFENKKALITFITGGDPDIETTEKLILAMEEAGADIIEIGIPFSDPVSEGVIIQEADKRALDSGCTADKLFDMVKKVRTKTDIPLLFMTYANPVYSYGTDLFMAKCKEAGIDGVIVPDAPFEEKDEFEEEANRHGICMISMIAPTSGGRIKQIACEAQGFLYCVSSLGVTGVSNGIKSNIAELIEEVKKTSAIPCAVGFGIFTPDQASDMAAVSDGVIVGSAIVRLIAKFRNECIEPVKQLVKELKNSIV